MRNRNSGQHNNNNRRSQNPMTRVYDSNGPDIKIRGTAAHIAEKYLQLARDSQSSGDPVAAENYYQHAEHYFRMIAAAQEQFRQNTPQHQQPRIDQDLRDDAGDDGEESFSNFGAEPGYGAREPQPAYQPREPQPYQPREARDQGGRDREPRDQGSRDQGGRDQQRESAPRESRQPQPQPQPDAADFERLPSFITGSAQPIATGAGYEGNGHQGGERFPPRRRRRPHGPRPEGRGPQPQPTGEDFSSGE